MIYTAVMGAYRKECVEILQQRLGPALAVYTGEAHLDPTVKTGIPKELYRPVRNRRLNSRLLFQFGGWSTTLKSEAAIIDLNPRSVTSWVLLLSRRAKGRRTVVWGHLHPQRGKSSPSAWLRRLMRHLSSGTLVYTYESAESASAELRGSDVWVAPNAIYRAVQIHPSIGKTRNAIVYSGRMEPSKKVGLLVHAFSLSRLSSEGFVLMLVGGGSLLQELKGLVRQLGIADSVHFKGTTYDVCELREIYAQAVCSVSPGYVGLSLTQSVGFGVPMVVARDEPHSPEIELERLGTVEYFDSDSVEHLAGALRTMSHRQLDDRRVAWSSYVRNFYSAEAMAQGVMSALLGNPDSNFKNHRISSCQANIETSEHPVALLDT